MVRNKCGIAIPEFFFFFELFVIKKMLTSPLNWVSRLIINYVFQLMMLRVQKSNNERRRRQAAQDKAGAIFMLTMLLNIPILLFQLVYRKMQPVVIIFVGTGTYHLNYNHCKDN